MKSRDTPRRIEKGLETVFALKRRNSLKNAFDHLSRFLCHSLDLRAQIMTEKTTALTHSDSASIEAISFLSNQIQGCLRFMSLHEQNDLNAALSHVVSHISTLSHQARSATAVLKRKEIYFSQAERPVEYSVVVDENTSLRHQIESLERQMSHLRTEKEKIQAAHRAIVSQHTRDNSVLRSNVARIKKESDESRKICFEKERMTQVALTQLHSSQDENKRLKIELRHTTHPEDEVNSLETLRLGGYGTSKYGFEEIMSLRAVNDALRLELHKERSSRNLEKISLNGNIDGIKLKSAAIEKTILDLREHLDAERQRYCAI